MVELTSLEAEALTDSVRLYDDSLEVLRKLRSRDVPTVLVSNCSWNTRPIVDRLGLEAEFDAVILSHEVGAMKPHPRSTGKPSRGWVSRSRRDRCSWTTRSRTAMERGRWGWTRG